MKNSPIWVHATLEQRSHVEATLAVWVASDAGLHVPVDELAGLVCGALHIAMGGDPGVPADHVGLTGGTCLARDGTVHYFDIALMTVDLDAAREAWDEAWARIEEILGSARLCGAMGRASSTRTTRTGRVVEYEYGPGVAIERVARAAALAADAANDREVGSRRRSVSLSAVVRPSALVEAGAAVQFAPPQNGDQPS